MAWMRALLGVAGAVIVILLTVVGFFFARDTRRTDTYLEKQDKLQMTLSALEEAVKQTSIDTRDVKDVQVPRITAQLSKHENALLALAGGSKLSPETKEFLKALFRSALNTALDEVKPAINQAVNGSVEREARALATTITAEIDKVKNTLQAERQEIAKATLALYLRLDPNKTYHVGDTLYDSWDYESHPPGGESRWVNSWKVVDPAALNNAKDAWSKLGVKPIKTEK